MKKKVTLLKISGLVVFLGTTAVLLYILLNYDSVPGGIALIALLCALVMYKHVFDIVKVIKKSGAENKLRKSSGQTR